MLIICAFDWISRATHHYLCLRYLLLIDMQQEYLFKSQSSIASGDKPIEYLKIAYRLWKATKFRVIDMHVISLMETI